MNKIHCKQLPKLRVFTVIYDEPSDIRWQFFRCQAEDSEHAEEQCLNAYPNCGVLWVNEGESTEMN